MLCDLDLHMSNDSSDTNHLQGTDQHTIEIKSCTHGRLTRWMTAVALDFALLARLTAHGQLLAFALRAALAPASVLATLFLARTPNLVIIFAWRVVRQF